MFINERTPELERLVPRWQLNRDFAAGEHSVKGRGTNYLPLATTQQPYPAYLAYKEQTTFYPAASKILDGLTGLINRQQYHLKAGPRVQTYAEVLTPQGDSLADVCDLVVRETLLTDFTGLLVDQPPGTATSLASADVEGFRVFLNVYPAETILGPEYGLIRNQRKLVRVRLLEEEGKRVRELLINTKGQYEVRIHEENESGQFYHSKTVIPRVNGQPLTEIPFVIVSLSDHRVPRRPMISDSVDLNLSHYRKKGMLQQVIYFATSPVPVVTGVTPKMDPENPDKPLLDDEGYPEVPEFPVYPGVVWTMTDKDAKAYYLEHEGNAVGTLENEIRSIKDDLAAVGFSILTPDKAAPDSPETIRLRRASENAIIASLSKTISRKIRDALRLVAMWSDGEPVEFSLKEETVPAPLGAQDITAYMALVQAGLMSRRTFFLKLKDAGVISSTLSYEEERDLIDQDSADRPSLLV